MSSSESAIRVFDVLTDTEEVFHDEDSAVEYVVKWLREGVVFVLPTDTVYGVACSAKIDSSIEGIFDLKGRELSKSLPVLVSGLEMIDVHFGPLDADERTRLEAVASKLWPGALTVVVSSSRFLPKGIQRGDASVAFRSPGESFSRLVGRYVPLACTSANRSGETPVTTYAQAIALLQDESIKKVLTHVRTLVIGDARPMAEQASTLVDLRHKTPRILREGPISHEEIVDALGG